MKSIPRLFQKAFAAAALSLAAPFLSLADGLIIIHDPPHSTIVPGHFSFAPLEVVYHKVDVEIDGALATTSIDQEFRNPNNARLEGTYIFPLPDGAHIDKFSMDVNGRMADAELLDAGKARSIYEEIVRKQRDPALLEYAGRGAFKARIFPIEPHSNKRVRISYTQLLKSEFGLTEYVYPLNTEKFSSAPLKELSLRVKIDGKEPLRSVYCPSHKAELRRDGEFRSVVGFEERNVRPDADFKVIFSRDTAPVGINMLCSRKSGEDGYFMLLASPGAVSRKAVAQPKDVCFVLDTSGSMAGEKLEQAKKALRFCLANLNPDDRFELIRFSTEAEPLFQALVPADKPNLDKAEDFVKGFKPIGGTAISEALGMALKLGGGNPARPYVVIFLTDGLPTVGETREEPIVDQAAKASASVRVFPFGIGADVNTHMLDRVASGTRGASQYVLPKEDIEVKLSNFYTKIKDPVLCDIKLSFSNPSVRVTQLHPNPTPDLFSGEMLVLFGRYSGSGPAQARIAGVFNGSPHEFSGDVNFASSEPGNSFIPQLWAARRVGWLLDEIRLRGESAELKDEATRLAREFGIVTPYTAYLIIEDERRRDVPVALRNFQELERDSGARVRLDARMDSVRKEAAAESARSGSYALDNAVAVQELKSVSSMPSALDGHVQGELAKSSAPATAASQGYRALRSQNYAQQARRLNGRTFYQNGNVWIDSAAQSRPGVKTRSVAFNSEDYFELLRKHPEAAQWLSLGNEIDLLIEDTLYQIRGT